MSSTAVGGKIEFTPHREIAHVRQDLSVTKEILAIVKDENERLRSLAEERTLEITRLGEELEESRRVFLDQKRLLESENARLKTNLASIEEELAESLAERKRLSDLIHGVKGQVDGRLTKLIEELQQKDESIHRLEYQNREYERDIERLNRVVKSEDALASELEAIQGKYSAASSEVLILQEQVDRYQHELSSLREKTQQLSDSGIGDGSQVSRLREVLSLFPLYRQWLSDVDVSLRGIEDQLEISLNNSIDSLALVTNPGVPYKPPSLERQRLAIMKKFERDQKKNELVMYPEVCDSYEESLAFSVHAIRNTWDSSRHSLEKVGLLSKQLLETMEEVLRVSGDLHAKTLSPQQPVELEISKKSSVECDQFALVESVKQDFQFQLRSREEELRRKDTEIANLKSLVSVLEGQKEVLNSELLKAKEDSLNTSIGSAAKISELECRLRETIRSSEEVSARTLTAVQLEHEKEQRDISETNLKLKNALEIETTKVDGMKKVLLESKRRRNILVEENATIRKQLQSSEELVNSLKVELLSAKRTIELLQAELHFAESRERRSSPTSSRTFHMFKKVIQRDPTNTKTMFLSKPL
ncbi:uncharacterized protein TM35_000431950 [Trypanosoma theileri]|uniref:Uncharacterized protein n=1 Tax=Trypanosoma theileri TaxID=67003 RepID=A0A1X0NJ15_9TRYP|nr:uncharacterized protein TM35_000431950 [Trypanosoma theileri]ORC84627.1 hypothetical protein TM35_000431950 [Trypanosoma theileri]